MDDKTIKQKWEDLGSTFIAELQKFYEDIEDHHPEIDIETVDDAVLDKVHSVIDCIYMLRNKEEYARDNLISIELLIRDLEY